MEQSLLVGMAEIKTLRIKPGLEGSDFTILSALGLGSCIGICMFDPGALVSGMAHVVLPESQGKCDDPPGKFANTAVPILIDEMVRLGAVRRRLVCAIAGGAQLFAFGSNGERQGIGERNAAAVKQALRTAGISLLAEDIGGNQGRTMRMSGADGRITVKTIGQGERQLVMFGETRPLAVRPLPVRVAA